MPDGQDHDETRALIGELQDALGGEPDMTAASGLGPRDRGQNDDDVVAGSSRPAGGGGGGGGGGGRRPPTDAPRPATTAPSAPGDGSRGRNVGALIAALVVGLVVGGGLAALFLNNGNGGDDFGGAIDSSRYQSVILTNDKVYFGQLTTASDTYYELDNAFFLRETRESADAEPVRA